MKTTIIIAVLLASTAAQADICIVRHDGYAYEGPDSAIEPKQLFAIKKGEQTVLAKWGKVWKYVQFDRPVEIKSENLKCKRGPL